MRVVVAGGGIGGLATALAVAASGARVDVLERATELKELGAGIQLAPNAFRALDRLGVARAIEPITTRIDRLNLNDGVRGGCLTSVDTGAAYEAEFGGPYAVVHRGQLHAALVAACRAARGITIHCSAQVSGYQNLPDGVVVRTADGRIFGGDLLVGADGIRSGVRRRLLGDGPPRISGHTIYRTLVPMARVPTRFRAAHVTLWAGAKWHFVHYPVAGGSLLNMAITRDDGAAAERTGVPVHARDVVGGFPELCGEAAQLLALGADWRSWVLCDRDPQPRWTDGRVALLGDAAHPMLQYAAQGACMALEDAIVLGEELARLGGNGSSGLNGSAEQGAVAGALRRYELLRRDRAGEVQLLARDVGSFLYHAEGDLAVRRAQRVAGLSQSALRAQLAWLHGSTSFTGGRADFGMPYERAA